MITIEEVQRTMAHLPSEERERQLLKMISDVSGLAFAQHEEIQKLRAWIDRNYQYVLEAKP